MEYLIRFIKQDNEKPVKLDGIELKSVQQFNHLSLVVGYMECACRC